MYCVSCIEFSLLLFIVGALILQSIPSDVPRVTFLTPNVFSKYGVMVKLQCNVTGYPNPNVQWIHRDTNNTIGNSSVVLFNITGRRSGGRYCCNATNDFGNEMMCTSVFVTEYEPRNTTLSSNPGYITKGKNVRLLCKADASPPPRYMFIINNSIRHNSSNGIYVHGMEKIKDEAENISCIPWNEKGMGEKKTISLPFYVFPRFTSDLRRSYIMAKKSINITCRSIGIPKPNITWTEEDSSDIISTKEYFEVPYMNSSNKTLTFYCNASNALGSNRSPSIKVHVAIQAKTYNGTYKVSVFRHGKPLNTSLYSYKAQTTAIGTILAVSFTVNIILVSFIVFGKIKELNEEKNKRETSVESRDFMSDNSPLDGSPMEEHTIDTISGTSQQQQEPTSSLQVAEACHRVIEPIYESIGEPSTLENSTLPKTVDQVVDQGCKKEPTIIKITFQHNVSSDPFSGNADRPALQETMEY